ncbi:MAG: ATP-binding cassette domain-containing protein, partial [Planctomycetes bacterium]|nr:ATP-binding cassette domain-containing protein [Planctomycetota bacterium]
ARMTEHLSGFVQRQVGAGGARARSLRAAEGLRPAIALRQRAEAVTAADRRATVATAAELHPVLRSVWSRVGDGELSAAAFSFFRREGACAGCAGLGSVQRCDPDRLIVDPSRPLFDGALRTDNKVVRDYADRGLRHRALLEAVAAARGFDLAAPWREQPEAVRDAVWFGCGDEQFDAVWEHDGAEGGAHRWRASWPGIARAIDAEHARRQQSGAKTRRQDFVELLGEAVCPDCDGERLQPQARRVQVAGTTLPALCRLSVDGLLRWLTAARDTHGGDDDERRAGALAADAFAELARLAERLVQLGVGHLQLDRAMATLSAGERQRVRLARQLAAPLTDCVYVLDEPTLGLHPRDVDELLVAFRGLVREGNAVVAVEHDLRVVAAADHVVEVGPGAGPDGGRIVAASSPERLPAASRTAAWLARPAAAARAAPRRPALGQLTVTGAHLHHLADLDVRFPLGQLTAVTGVSGSGKSTLMRGVLAASLSAGAPVGCRGVDGGDAFAGFVDDADARRQRTRASCVATLLGVFDELRKRFAATDAARERGFRAAHFAFGGRSGGACRACSGVGWVRSDFDFLGGGQWLPCEACEGRRFDAETLAVRWQGRDLAGWLDASLAELLAEVPARGHGKLREPLELAVRLGLGYLTLGQSGDALSGGEAQRVSLAAHLLAGDARSRGSAPLLFLLDEPTRGLHPDDVVALQVALDELLAEGHTIVAVEHDLAVIAAADHVVDLGPGAGADGGRLVFCGSPRELVRCEESRTGRALRGI